MTDKNDDQIDLSSIKLTKKQKDDKTNSSQENNNQNKEQIKVKSKEENIEELKHIIQELEKKYIQEQSQSSQLQQMKEQQSQEIQKQKFIEKSKYLLAKDQENYVSFVERENNHVERFKLNQKIILNPKLQNRQIDPFMHQSALDQELSKDRDMPSIYKDYFADNPSQTTPVNIGPKWEELMKKTTKNSLEYNSNFKRGNFVMDAFKKGKMGIDAYFVIFGLLGVSIIPTYLYFHLKPYKDYQKNVRGITKENTPDPFYSKQDLDDISLHKTYYNMYSEEINEQKRIRIANAQQLEELNDKIYAPKFSSK